MNTGRNVLKIQEVEMTGLDGGKGRGGVVGGDKGERRLIPRFMA